MSSSVPTSFEFSQSIAVAKLAEPSNLGIKKRKHYIKVPRGF